VPSGGGGASTITNNSSDLIIRDNRFEYNSSGQGGALNIDSGAAPLIDANTIISNTASFGGGIFLYNAGSATITNNIIARNNGGYGGGVVCNGSPAKIINNTIDDNIGDGVFFSDADGIAVVNNIISGNSEYGIESYYDPPTSIYTTNYNDVFNNTSANYSGLAAGSNDLSLDPKFEGASSDLFDYYHIQKSSPVSTTGSTAWAPLRDIDYEWRNLFGTVSMGADEVLDGVIVTYLPLIFKNYP
jgi:parallel beta-helix repeat protein